MIFINSENNVWKIGRNIIFGDDVNSKSISSAIQLILQVNVEDQDKDLTKRQGNPIKLFINTNGGNVYDVLALVDVIITSKTPVYTYALGKCFSAGFIMFICGHKRYVGENAYLMTHYMHNGVYGSIIDVEHDAEHNKNLNSKLDEIIISKTRISKEQIDENTKIKKDWYFDAKQCLAYGIADELYQGQ